MTCNFCFQRFLVDTTRVGLRFFLANFNGGCIKKKNLYTTLFNQNRIFGAYGRLSLDTRDIFDSKTIFSCQHRHQKDTFEACFPIHKVTLCALNFRTVSKRQFSLFFILPYKCRYLTSGSFWVINDIRQCGILQNCLLKTV